MVWVGRISYGLYLWHWPVNVYLTEARVGLGGTQLNVLRLVVTFAIATVSYYLLEMPVRRGALRTRRALARSAAVAFTGIAIVAATAGARTGPQLPGRRRPSANSFGCGPITRRPRDHLPRPRRDASIVRRPGARLGPGPVRTSASRACPPPHAVSCGGAAGARQAGPPPAAARGPVRVLVIGDSLACSVNIGLEPAGAPAIITRQIAMVGCGVVSDEVFDKHEPYPKFTEQCHRLVTGPRTDALARFHPRRALISTWERFNLVRTTRCCSPAPPPGTTCCSAGWTPVRHVPAGGRAHRDHHGGARRPRPMIGGGRIVEPRSTGDSRR